MDVAKTKEQEKENEKAQAGFTLIESIVAMGLFVGVVFLLISVFNEFLINDYSTKLKNATMIAANQIQNVVKNRTFELVEKDTIGFHVTQKVTMRNGVVLVDVAVRDAKRPQIQYIKLTKAISAN